MDISCPKLKEKPRGERKKESNQSINQSKSFPQHYQKIHINNNNYNYNGLMDNILKLWRQEEVSMQ